MVHLQLMHVPEIGPSLIGRYDGEMNVKISVLLLGASNIVDELLNCGVDFSIVFLEQEIACAFDPFGDVAIPKQVCGYRPCQGEVLVVRRVPLELKTMVAAGSA